MKLNSPGSGYALIAAAVALTYANAATASFQFDDWDVIVFQPLVHSIGAWWGSMPGIRPLLKLSYAANYAISPGPIVFHVENVAIHAANACLICALLAKRTTRAIALTTALIFALHPAQTEAVTYVTGRSSSLSALFVLLTLSFSTVNSWLSPALFACALMVKETAVMAAVPLLRLRRGLSPLLVLAGAAVIAAASPVYRHLLEVSLRTRGIGTNLMTQAHAIVYLMGQLVRFDRLNADPALPAVSALSLRVAGEALLIVSLIVLGFVLRKKRPEVGYGILWFFLWLVPTNSILPRLDVVNDRQLYLALAGPAFLVAYGIGALAKKRAGVALTATVLLCATLASATHVRNRVYHDEITFWSDVVAKSPWNARGFNNLGFVLAKSHRDDEADAALRRALELDPNYVRAAVNLKLLRAGALIRR